MSEEIIKGGNGEVKGEQASPSVSESKPQAVTIENPPTDFKLAEIWIRSGQVYIEAVESFWKDRLMALGVIEVCKDIIKNASFPAKEKSQIIQARHGIMNFVRNGFRRKKK